MTRHETQNIKLHGETIEIDINMVELMTKINKTKLTTRGCCENYDGNNAYIIFEYNCFVELLNNDRISNFIDDFCTKSEIYYADNKLRHIKYDNIEYNEKFKNMTEIWIYVTFSNMSLKDFENII